MPDIERDTYLAMAKEAASLAGDFLAGCDRSSIKVNHDDGKDIKIDTDVRSEEIILKHLVEHSPHSILSEEKGLMPRENNEAIWIVDPLDGTMNYFKNIPACCVSIGLWHQDKPLLGVVYDFNAGDFFTGIVGEGAWINDQKINVSEISKKEKAVLSTGFPAHADFSTDVIKSFIEDLRTYKKIRMIGSAALSICYVACGRVDAYCEKDIMFWDIAGGIPVVLGGGGMADYQNARRQYSYDVYVSNGQLKQL